MINQNVEFLLSWQYDNFFSKASARPDEFMFECKGCGEIVPQWERKKHFEKHKTDRTMIREANKLAANMNRQSGNGDTRVDVCLMCGAEFEQPRRRGRPRKNCYECLPEGS